MQGRISRSAKGALIRGCHRNLVGLLLLVASATGQAAPLEPSDQLDALMRSRVEEPVGSGRFELVYRAVTWNPRKTAIIVCDMWNTMRCKIPADRVAEMVPRVNQVVTEARQRGVLIVHAPSGTMDYYANTPQRRRCLEAPRAQARVPLQWNAWNQQREAPLPVDDSDGGWQGPVKPGTPPQTRQHPGIEIAEVDAVGEGAEIYNLLQQRGIDNVILMGVHTNICVLGRPFGIRQMTYLGKNVALMRDLTDSLYNPAKPPRVNHIRGTELLVEHIEKYWCPTLTSTDLVGQPAFRFKEDARPHLVLVVSDDHYQADKTLPRFAQTLRKQHGLHCSVLHGQGKANLPNIVELEGADALVVYVRRLGLPKHQVRALQKYVRLGGPIIGLRTASHAFTMHRQEPARFQVPTDRAEWRRFDADVLGGNYHGHGPNQLGTTVHVAPAAAAHPILSNVDPRPWHSLGSLYYTNPVAADALVLMTGAIPDQEEPLAWVRTSGPGRVFYSSLGHPDDFRKPQFIQLLRNAIYWAMGRPVPESQAALTPAPLSST